MSRKTLGFVLVAAGVVVLAVGLGADAMGMGAVPGFGWKQLVASIAGAVIAVVGVWLATRKAA